MSPYRDDIVSKDIEHKQFVFFSGFKITPYTHICETAKKTIFRHLEFRLSSPFLQFLCDFMICQ